MSAPARDAGGALQRLRAGSIPDAGETTTGNNVDACLDRTAGVNANICDTGALANDGRPIGNPDGARNRVVWAGGTNVTATRLP